jgi:hypothetical protein
LNGPANCRDKPRLALGTRTVDLLHVAVALEFAAACLYSFDQQQPAARQMGRVALFCNCRKKYHLDAGYQGPLNVTGAMESLGKFLTHFASLVIR